MIQTKQDLKFYIAADRIMNGRTAKRDIAEIIVGGGVIINYLRAMRHCAYYQNTVHSKLSPRMILRHHWSRRFSKLGLKLGFSIGANSLGYGVVIPHYGTIVVNGEALVGNFAVLHTCTCIAGKKTIGDYFYLSAGSQVTGDITLGDGVSVSAHSLVNKSSESNVLLVGAPAQVKKTNYPLWVERDGETFMARVKKVKELQKAFR